MTYDDFLLALFHAPHSMACKKLLIGHELILSYFYRMTSIKPISRT